MVVVIFKTTPTDDTENSIYRLYVMDSYMCPVNRNGNLTPFRLPTLSHKLCRKVWLELFMLPRRTINTLKSSIGPSLSIRPLEHFLIGRESNNYKNNDRNAICNYNEMVAAVDGHALPISMRRTDVQY